MGITNVTETAKAPAAAPPQVPRVAPAPAPAEEPVVAVGPTKEQEAEAEPKVVTPPPPPPVHGYDVEVRVGEHARTGRKVYGFLDPDSGQVIVQIPIDSVLNLVADIVAKMRSEGRA